MATEFRCLGDRKHMQPVNKSRINNPKVRISRDRPVVVVVVVVVENGSGTL